MGKKHKQSVVQPAVVKAKPRGQLSVAEVLRPALKAPRIRKLATCNHVSFRIFPEVKLPDGEVVRKVFTVSRLEIDDPTAIEEGAGHYTMTLVRRWFKRLDGEKEAVIHYSLKDRGKGQPMTRQEAIKWLAARLPGEEKEATEKITLLGEHDG